MSETADIPALGSLPPLAERLLLVGLLFGSCFSGYYLLGLTQDPAAAWTLRTPLDEAIPFLPVMTWFYTWVYTAMLYPMFVVRSRRLFRRVCLAYAIVVGVSLACFAVFPVTAHGLRPDPATLDLGTFHGWGLRLNYHWDPPMNLFPSLHLGGATLAALAAWRADRRFGWPALALVAVIAVAVCAVKQHYAVDAVAGLALAAGAYAWALRGFEPRPEDLPLATDARGPAAYLAFHASVFLGLYALYRADFRPWE